VKLIIKIKKTSKRTHNHQLIRSICCWLVSFNVIKKNSTDTSNVRMIVVQIKIKIKEIWVW